MATEIAKAYVQIIPKMTGVKATLENELGGEADKAGAKAGERAGSGFTGKFAAAIGKGTALLGAAAATAVGAVAKSAVANYADYEQLVGGIETLFKDSSEIVQEYAANAYKTAGISANEYMETVTSFSASLLQSLGGDTEAAAKAADVAITDMADNANKMGTSMESIQNAYQGFAKQNYTMLDNLKLGYGGTKEEMQRLLADAEAFSGVHYDISSLADVYEAIHVVQTELGITGTTAKEASETISGSAAAMKAAWQNMLTGIADDNADFDKLIGDLVSSAKAFLKNITPRIGTALQGVASLVSELAPVIAAELPALVDTVLPSLIDATVQLANALVTALPGIMQSIVSVIPSLMQTAIDVIATTYPMLIQVGFELLSTLARSIAENLPVIIPAVVGIIIDMVETLTDPENIAMLVDASIAIMTGLVDGIISALPQLIAAAPVIIENLVTALVNEIPKLLQAAADMVIGLVEGIIDNLPSISDAANSIITTLDDGIQNLMEKIRETGSNIVNGVWEGIQAKWEWLKEKVGGFFSGIIDGAKNVLQIASPSKVFAEIGAYTAEGFGEGFGDEFRSIKNDVTGEVGSIIDSVNGTTLGINASVASGVASGADASPVIGAQTFELVLDGNVVSTFLVDIMRREVRMA